MSELLSAEYLEPTHRDGRALDLLPANDLRNLDYLAAPMEEPVGAPPWRHYDKRYDLFQDGVSGCAMWSVFHATKILVPGFNPTDGNCLDGYRWCLDHDPFAGNADTGTDLNTALKVPRAFGLISSWSWLSTVEAVRDALLYRGPVVCGLNWTTGMARPNPQAFMTNAGTPYGPHATVVTGYYPPGMFGPSAVWELLNQWEYRPKGWLWGNGDVAYIADGPFRERAANRMEFVLPVR